MRHYRYNIYSVCLVTLLFGLLSFSNTTAQTSIHDGTGAAPDNSAMLDVQGNNTGVLIPRVSLTSTATFSPVVGTAIESLLIYNTNGTIGKGYYYWNGTEWTKLLNGNAGSLSGGGTQNYIPKWTPTGSQLGNSQIFDNGTNVGIGNAVPGHQLSVGAATADGQAVTVRGYSNAPGSWKGGGAFGYTSATVIMGELNGYAQIGGHNSTLSAWADLSLNSAGGNVGIGTTTPDQKLEVENGRIRITHSGGGVLELTNSTLPKTNYVFTDTDGHLNARTDDATKNVLLQTGGTQGNVGIGITAPATDLQVHSGTAYSGTALVTGADRPGIMLSGTYPHMVIASSVNNANHAGTLSFWHNNNGGATTSMWNMGASEAGFTIGYGTNNANPHLGLEDYTTPSVLSLETSGNVGIGTISPGYKLEVNGNINASTTIRAVGNMTNGGFDFSLGNTDQVTRGNSGASRALVKESGSILTLNYGGDFTGGTKIGSLSGTGIRMVTADAAGLLGSQTLPGGVLPAGTTAQTLYHNGSGWTAGSNLSNTGSTINLGQFTTADNDEWPYVTWLRNTGLGWDEGLIKGSSSHGVWGRAGFGIHMSSTRHFGFFSSGWDALFDVEGGTGRTYIKGNTGIGDTSPDARLNIFTADGSSDFPSTSSLGDIDLYLERNNQGIEFGQGGGGNERKSWILARHNGLPTYGQYYQSMHVQPALNDVSQYRGVGIGYAASTAIPVNTYLAVAGDVGIGTLSPEAKLHVANTSVNNWTWSTLSNNVSLELGINGANNVGSIRLNSYVADQYVFLRPSNGNYHIDATTGQYYFNWDESVRGTSNGGIHMANESGGHTVEFNSAGSSWLTGGNFGLGETVPTERLHVNGNARVTGLAGSGNRPVHADANGVLQTNGTITRIDPLYVRGTGLNHNANRVLKVGSTQVYNGGGRGLTLTIISKADHSIISTTTYDSYGNAGASNNLATALNGVDNGEIGILTSYDAWEGQVTANLKDAFQRLGLYKAFMTTVGGSRRTYAAVFEGSSSSSIPSVSAVEVEHSDNANQPYSEIRGWLIDGGFVASSQVPSGLSTPTGDFAVGVDEGGNVQVDNLSGTGTRSVYSTNTGILTTAAPAGQVLNMVMENITGGSVNVSSTGWTTVASYTYTRVSNNSYIMVEFNTDYDIGGYGGDSFFSGLWVGGTQVGEGWQKWDNHDGGGTRSGILFPVVGRYTNSATGTVTIEARARRSSADDTGTFYRDLSTWFKVTEVSR